MALKDKYFTISEAAKELHVTRQTISRWIKEGKLHGERIGRETLIDKEQCLGYRSSRMQKAVTESIIELYKTYVEEYAREKGYWKNSTRIVFYDPEKQEIDKKAPGIHAILSKEERTEIIERFSQHLDELFRDSAKTVQGEKKRKK